MPQFDQIRNDIRRLWDSMELRPERAESARRAAARIAANKDRYIAAAAPLGLPWPFVGLTHLRESNLNFSRHLHNGDALTARTWRVPARRPVAPPRNGSVYTWEESAEDALRMKNLHTVQDWSIERLLFELERYNGFGYRNNRAGNSPYVWADSNHYRAGKYVRDGVYDPNHVDTQNGVASVLKCLIDAGHFSLDELDDQTAVLAPPAEDAPAGPAPDLPPLRTRSRKYALSKWMEKIALGLTAALAAVKARLEGLWNDPWGALDTVIPVIKSYGVEAAIILAVCGWGVFRIYKMLIVDDLKRGAYRPSGD